MKDSDQGDHAWGWVITAAVFGCNSLCVGYYRAFGVFFVEIIDAFQSSSSVTSLIMGVQAAVLSVSALVVHAVLLPVAGERRSAVAGGLLMAAGMTLASCATSIPFLLFSLSVLVGLGNAMTYGPGLVLLGQYFERRRALAMAVANTGASVGSMTLPLLATHLLHSYGLSGAWLLYGGVTLHLCVFASLYRPLEAGQHSSHQASGDDPESSHAMLQDENAEEKFEAPSVAPLHEKCPRLASSKVYVVSDLVHDNHLKAIESLKSGVGGACSEKHTRQNGTQPLTQNHLARLGEGSNAREFCSAEDVYSGQAVASTRLHGRRSNTLGDLRFPSPHHLHHHHHHHRHHHCSHSSVNSMSAVLQRRLIRDAALHSSHPHLLVVSPSLESLSQGLRADHASADEGSQASSRRGCAGLWSSVACDADLLRKPLFWLVQAYVCVGVVGATGAGVYLPALCRERGLDRQDTALVLTTWGALNLAGRLLCGLLADRQWLRPSSISVLAFLAIGLLFQALRFLPPGVGSMVALAAVYGVFEGAYFTMLPLIIIDYVTLPPFSRTFGFVQLSQGAFATMSYPLLGSLRDITGDYYATFHCLGASALMASMLLLLESGARALRTARSSEKNLPSSHDL